MDENKNAPYFELSGSIWDDEDKLTASQIEDMFFDWLEEHNLLFISVSRYLEDEVDE